jgi:hypothetical protein
MVVAASRWICSASTVPTENGVSRRCNSAPALIVGFWQRR